MDGEGGGVIDARPVEVSAGEDIDRACVVESVQGAPGGDVQVVGALEDDVGSGRAHEGGENGGE